MKKKAKSRRQPDDTRLTAAMRKTARPFRELPPAFIKAVRKSLGRPPGRTKEPIHLSLDADLVQALRNTGKGWQTRTNSILRKAMKLPPTVHRDTHI